MAVPFPTTTTTTTTTTTPTPSTSTNVTNNTTTTSTSTNTTTPTPTPTPTSTTTTPTPSTPTTTSTNTTNTTSTSTNTTTPTPTPTSTTTTPTPSTPTTTSTSTNTTISYNYPLLLQASPHFPFSVAFTKRKGGTPYRIAPPDRETADGLLTRPPPQQQRPGATRSRRAGSVPAPRAAAALQGRAEAPDHHLNHRLIGLRRRRDGGSTHWGSNTVSTLTLFRDDGKPDPGSIPMAGDPPVGTHGLTTQSTSAGQQALDAEYRRRSD
ncbi:unnamed protein product [Arctogadus glacialis]